MTKQFEHDCSKCFFIGRSQKYDLYFCEQHTLPTVIARYGDKGHQYLSGMALAKSVRIAKDMDADIVALRVAYLIAADMGLFQG